MKKTGSGRSTIVAAGLGGFLAGAIVMAVVLLSFSSALRWPAASSHRPPEPLRAAEQPPAAERKDPPPANDVGSQGVAASPPTPLPSPPAVAEPPPRPSTAPAIIEADPLSELRDRKLEVPVRGVARGELRDTFDQARRVTENHEAIDILAQRNTPVVAVEDGTIVKLFESKKGGTTVYQFDPSTRYTYYYAHLERYAAGLQEGNRVQRGQVLGYVGTSGNAPKDTPHLHFAIFRLTDKKQWWQGSPIDPYEVLK
jgi:murein DD-endopeptidase MepM/ murein hydrolase activator NlpD